MLLLAAGYELTPLKNVCLGKCRSPLGTLLGSWRDGWTGALRMGANNGAWCVGCCWALMASLFALGVMSVTWMAIVAGVIAVEKILPWRRAATYGTALALLALGVLILVAPDALPGLTVPGQDPMPVMTPMQS
jgi:predicted metal-binding membrane protein